MSGYTELLHDLSKLIGKRVGLQEARESTPAYGYLQEVYHGGGGEGSITLRVSNDGTCPSIFFNYAHLTCVWEAERQS